jgi:hypothetical protein
VSDQQQTSEIYQSVSETIRTGVMVAMEVAELMAMARMERARQAEMADSREREAIKERLRAERQAARPAIRQAWNERWWERAGPQEIAGVYQLAAGWARTGDDYAAAAADHMRAEIQRRYGVEIPELAPHDDVLAALLAADAKPTEAQQRRQREEEAALEEPGESFEPSTGDGYRYQIRDAAGEEVAAGELILPAGATAQDAALAAIDEYRRLPEREPDARIGRLYDVAHDRAEPAQLPDGAHIAITPAAQDGAAPVYVLDAADEQAVRAERQEWRRQVLSGAGEPSPQEQLAAVVLEERAVREEDRAAQAQARTGDPAVQADAEARAAAAGDRLRDLAIRRAAAEESVRGGEGEYVLRSAVLRSHLDRGWWQTASPQEASELWRHVSEWPEGAGRAETQAMMRAEIGVRFGADLPPDTDPDRAAELIREGYDRMRERYQREADALIGRGQDEKAAANAELDEAVAAAHEGDPEIAGAEAEAAELDAAAAEADFEAAAALDATEDVETAEAVRTAAMVVDGTPQQRLEQGLEHQAATGSGPGAGRGRELTPAQSPNTGAER